ncbi:MAG: hypothetical protein QXF56_05165 [Candidatus Micrarchaeia archaeon]
MKISVMGLEREELEGIIEKLSRLPQLGGVKFVEVKPLGDGFNGGKVWGFIVTERVVA